MTYDECISTYGSEFANTYCSQFASQEPVFIPEESKSRMDSIIDFFSDNWIILLAVIVLIVIMMISATIIRQQEVGVVERLGRYNRSLQAGFHLIIPFIERVRDRVDLEQFDINVNSNVKTQDDQMVSVPVVVILRVIPEQASTSVYEVDDPEAAIKALVSNEIKAQAATMTLEEIYADRDTIKVNVLETLGAVINSYGFDVRQVVIDNPVLPPLLQEAYNSVAVAEKAKQAAKAQGEALKITLVAEAEANGAALVIQGESYVINRDKIAEGNSAAIKKMVADTDLTAAQALGLLIAIDSNDAVRDASAHEGSTVVIATGNSNDKTLGMVANKQL